MLSLYGWHLVPSRANRCRDIVAKFFYLPENLVLAELQLCGAW